MSSIVRLYYHRSPTWRKMYCLPTSEINIKKISNWATGHSSLKKTDYVQTKYATLTQLTLLALHVCTQLSYHVNQSDHELLLLSWLCVWQNHNLVNLAKPFWESRVEWWWWCWQWIKKSCCENGRTTSIQQQF